MAVALPAVGVLDMPRYHTFAAGAGWSYDYGTAEQSRAMFKYLLGYSPVHNVQTGTVHPATPVTTGDHDDRVVPALSFKFATRLQAKHAGAAPVLIRVEQVAGHGAGTPTSKIIDLYADVLAFTFANMADPADPAEAPNMAKIILETAQFMPTISYPVPAAAVMKMRPPMPECVWQ